MRSVCDSGGSTLRNTFIIGEVSSGLRMKGSSSGTAITATMAAATIVAVWLTYGMNQQAASSTRLMIVQVIRRIRW